MFKKIFIVESDPDWLTLLSKFLSTATQKKNIVPISKIDEAFQLIEESGHEGCAAFIDIFWDGHNSGIALANSLRDAIPSIKMVAYTGIKLNKNIMEELKQSFDAIVHKESTNPYSDTIRIEDVNRDFLKRLAKGEILLQTKRDGFHESEPDTHDLETQYYFEIESDKKVNSQFVATDFHQFSQLEEDLQLDRFKELHKCIKGILQGEKYSDNKLIVLFTGDGVIIGILEESVAPIALELSFDLNDNLRRSNISQELRIGVHEGIVYHLIGTKGESQLIGPGINMAARLESASKPGKILVSEGYFSKYVRGRSEDFVRELTYDEEPMSFEIKEDKFQGRFVWKGKKAAKKK